MSGKQGEWCMIGVYGGVCEGEYMGYSLGYEPLILKRYYSTEMPQPYEALEGRKSNCGSPQLERIRGKFLFPCLLALLSLISWHDACRTAVVGAG